MSLQALQTTTTTAILATTTTTIGAWFTAEGFAVAHHGFCRLDSALTGGVALALDEICGHGEYPVGTLLFYASRMVPNRGTTDPRGTV